MKWDWEVGRSGYNKRVFQGADQNEKASGVLGLQSHPLSHQRSSSSYSGIVVLAQELPSNCLRVVLSNRDILSVTGVILNSLIATIKKQRRDKIFKILVVLKLHVVLAIPIC